MNTTPIRPAAEEAAAHWAARLEGSSLSAAERAQLDGWLDADPVHRSLLSEYCQLSTDLELLLPALVATGGADLPAPVPARRRTGRRLAFAATALAAAAALAFAFWPTAAAEQHESIATPAALRRTLTLADGTQVVLNAQTVLRVEISGESRRVQLAAGQAFFQVTADPGRPFTVETPAGSVRVTGTEFEVQTGNNTSLEVLVADGTVQVRPADPGDGRSTAPVLLQPGDRLRADVTGVARTQLSGAALEDALAWRQGWAIFKGTPLNDALARFARYHGVGLAATPAAAGLRVGGRFSLDDLDGFLTTLEEVLPVRVTRGMNGTVQVALAEGR